MYLYIKKSKDFSNINIFYILHFVPIIMFICSNKCNANKYTVVITMGTREHSQFFSIFIVFQTYSTGLIIVSFKSQNKPLAYMYLVTASLQSVLL